MNRTCSCRKTELIKQMRRLWSQHVYWTRFFIISTAEELEDLRYVTDRLLQNPGDFARTLLAYYGSNKAGTFKKLLTEHLKIAADLVNADKNNNTEKADSLRKKWFENADDIAEFLAQINPYWNENKWKKMLYSHLDMTEKEAALRLKKQYPKDIEIFDSVEKEALDMADYMSDGIIKQFLCN